MESRLRGEMRNTPRPWLPLRPAGRPALAELEHAPGTKGRVWPLSSSFTLMRCSEVCDRSTGLLKNKKNRQGEWQGLHSKTVAPRGARGLHRRPEGLYGGGRRGEAGRAIGGRGCRPRAPVFLGLREGSFGGSMFLLFCIT